LFYRHLRAPKDRIGTHRKIWNGNVQTNDIKYQPLIRPQMRRSYYDPTKYQTYLDATP
jgi:hypothetical protein